VAAQQAALNFGLGEILRMKISARNVLAGTVKKVTKGAVNAEVVLALKEGDTMTAIITNHSVDSLGLREGNSAYAIIKASEVMVGKNVEGAKLSARNVLAGEVARLEQGVVNSEVEIRLPGGTTVIASITKASVSALDLRQGDKVSAIIKASHVLVGV
jgi:molybdate transport system regulatory protein